MRFCNPYRPETRLQFNIDRSYLSDIPSIKKFDNSFLKRSSVILLSDFLTSKGHNQNINPPIIRFQTYVENSIELWRKYM